MENYVATANSDLVDDDSVHYNCAFKAGKEGRVEIDFKSVLKLYLCLDQSDN